jgi:transposase
VESTYNWYWLVDLMMEEGYQVHLANPSRVQQYSGLKHGDDEDDAFWLAEMLRLKILTEGFIYPREQRPLRDLLRKRGHLVRLRTSLILSLKNILARNIGAKMNANHIKALRKDQVTPLLAGVRRTQAVSTEIDHLMPSFRSRASSSSFRPNPP